jgi:hypothetical protein
MMAFIAFITKIAPFLNGVLSLFKDYNENKERQKQIEIGKELERGKVHEQNAINEKKERDIEQSIKKSGDDSRDSNLNDSLRNGKF